jgi:hypothetical protein
MLDISSKKAVNHESGLSFGESPLDKKGVVSRNCTIPTSRMFEFGSRVKQRGGLRIFEYGCRKARRKVSPQRQTACFSKFRCF